MLKGPIIQTNTAESKTKKNRTKTHLTRLRPLPKRNQVDAKQTKLETEPVAPTAEAVAQLELLVARLGSILGEEEIAEIAFQSGFQKREGKIQSREFLLLMIEGASNPEQANLKHLASALGEMPSGSLITAQAIAARLWKPETVAFLGAAFEKVLAAKLVDTLKSPEWLGYAARFPRILIEDSTICRLHNFANSVFKASGGDPTRSAYKLDLIFEVVSGSIKALKVVDGSATDPGSAYDVIKVLQPGDLVLRDLGYFCLPSFRQIEERGAYFISRFKRGVSAYTPQGKPIMDMYRYLIKRCKGNFGADVEVVLGYAERYKVRLIAAKAPKQVHQQRLRELKNYAAKHSTKVADEAKQLAKLTILITNIPYEMVPAEGTGTLYRIRWDVELIFKAWKSQIHIDMISGYNVRRIECFIISKLICILLITAINSYLTWYANQILNLAISMTNVFGWIKQQNRFYKLLWGHNFADILLKMLVNRPHEVCKQRRTRNTTREDVESRTPNYGIDLERHVYQRLAA